MNQLKGVCIFLLMKNGSNPIAKKEKGVCIP